MKTLAYLREVCETHARVTTDSAKVLALLDLADAVIAWRDAVCETESAETDDYTVANAASECAGDTHAEGCPVAVAQRGVIAAAARLPPPAAVAEGLVTPLPEDRPWKRRMAEALAAGGCASQTEWVAKFPGVHCWFKFGETDTGDSCVCCGTCRRRDDKNKPCKGIVTIELRGQDPA